MEKSGLKGLLSTPNKGENKNKNNPVENIDSNNDPSKTFTIYAKKSTIEKMNNIQWLKSKVIDLDDFTKEDIILEALNLLAEKIDYEKLTKKYKKNLEKNNNK